MYQRLLSWLQCPECGGSFKLEPLVVHRDGGDPETDVGLLHCPGDHWFPVVKGIPRLLADSLDEHWSEVAEHVRASGSPTARMLLENDRGRRRMTRKHDRRTQANFSFEWQYYELGDKTWGIPLDDRVREFFLDAIRIPVDDLKGMVVLDAGCGNGSQSVAYTEFGPEIIALDLSSGLEHGQAYRHIHKGAVPDRVHFVQADLQSPPIKPGCIDIIHSVGVLQATPNTKQTFDGLCPLLRADATYYVWLIAYEPVVTPILNTIRVITTRIPSTTFARMASVMARPAQAFFRTVNAVGIRTYPPMERREAALAIMDILGTPYAHYHSFTEVEGWFRQHGFDEVWECNVSRRGFGACGRRRPA
ncbi:MAG: methyltransferase domain-containing protein [Actinomycetota bacterium]|nr:methyltransferase domain-containing protein [Actinomycetota bacterium]